MKHQLIKTISTLTLSAVLGILSVLQCFALDGKTAVTTGDVNRTLVIVLGAVMAVAVILIIILSITKKKK